MEDKVVEKKEKSLVVIQLSGGNDAKNTIDPNTNAIYHDSRSAIHLTERDVIDIAKQMNGGEGLSQEYTLARMKKRLRTLRNSERPHEEH